MARPGDHRVPLGAPARHPGPGRWWARGPVRLRTPATARPRTARVGRERGAGTHRERCGPPGRDSGGGPHRRPEACPILWPFRSPGAGTSRERVGSLRRGRRGGAAGVCRRRRAEAPREHGGAAAHGRRLHPGVPPPAPSAPACPARVSAAPVSSVPASAPPPSRRGDVRRWWCPRHCWRSGRRSSAHRRLRAGRNPRPHRRRTGPRSSMPAPVPVPRRPADRDGPAARRRPGAPRPRCRARLGNRHGR